jgi:hypothetical protein
VKKSLIVIASALLVAIGAAGHHRLRYDSTVFVDTNGPMGGPRATRVEYPPCVKGVREDRCIQLYERGMRRSYSRWLAAHGRGGERAVATRQYRPCRGRGDDNCQQRSVRRQARVVQPARARQAQRRAVARPARIQRAAAPARVRRAAAAPARPAVRQQPVRAAEMQRRRPAAPAPRQPVRPRAPGVPSGTPGI